MRRLTSSGWFTTSYPATFAVPSVGGRKHVKTRIVVVFPAPLGPKNPTICPFSTSKEMLSTATVRAYRLVRPSTLIIWCVPARQTEILPLGAKKARKPAPKTEIPMKFHNKEGDEGLSNKRSAALQNTYTSRNAIASTITIAETSQ